MPGIEPAAARAPEVLCDAFNASFSDYLIGPPHLAHAHWPNFLRRQGVDLEASRVLCEAGEVIAFALVALLGRRCRLAVTGVRPADRGTGAASRLLDLVVAEARGRGAVSMELEVFEQNTRALGLYRSRGFEPLAALHGYAREPGAAAAEATRPREVDASEAVEWLARQRIDGLPFQMSAGCIAVTAPPLRAWQQGSAQLVAAPRGEHGTFVLSLVDATPDQLDARLLLRHLAALHPNDRLSVPQLQRHDLGGRAFEAEGWQREALWQWLMRLPLQG
jgi:ribosomal protein S18 acetylase RimI-like enzyme